MTSQNNISRRQFIKGTLAGAGALTVGLPRPGSAAASKKQEEPLATLIDISKCIGCEECVSACREANAAHYPRPEKPFPKMVPSRVPVEDWSNRQDVTDRLTPYNWLFIQRASATYNDEDFVLTIPRRCMHCANPPCVKLCPWGAARQESSGTSRIDPDLCLGGSKCNTVCPWDIPQRQTGVGLYLDLLPTFAGNGVMYKCNRCHQRMETGDLPACIDVCPEEVQVIGPRSEIIRQAHKIADQINGYVYGETENGGTHTLYVSPVPFEILNGSVDTGKGKPGFAQVKDMMKQGTLAAAALFIAPFAGIAAAFTKHLMAGKEVSK